MSAAEELPTTIYFSTSNELPVARRAITKCHACGSMAIVVTAVSTTDTSIMTELARPVHEKATSAASCHVNVLGPKVLEEKVLGPKSTESESESRWIWTQALTQNTDIIYVYI